jgi:hypothetical protein
MFCTLRYSRNIPACKNVQGSPFETGNPVFFPTLSGQIPNLDGTTFRRQRFIPLKKFLYPQYFQANAIVKLSMYNMRYMGVQYSSTNSQSQHSHTLSWGKSPQYPLNQRVDFPYWESNQDSVVNILKIQMLLHAVSSVTLLNLNKTKLSLCPVRNYTMKAQGEVELQHHA